MNIRYLKHTDIDKEKWQKCLDQSSHPLIYANSFYLDVVSPNWSAFVIGNYEAIFPLPIKRKLSLSYVAHPLFTQQLGLFSPDMSKEVNLAMIKSMKEKFRRYDLRLHPFFGHGQEKSTERLNLILNLDDCQKISSKYNQNTRRNIKKFNGMHLKIAQDLEVDEFIEFKKTNSRADLNKGEWKVLARLIQILLQKKMGFFQVVRQDSELISAVFFSVWKNRLYYLFSASNEEGMNARASFGIVNEVIHNYCGKDMILDFEGSNTESIARFFRGFGAKEEIYYELKRTI